MNYARRQQYRRLSHAGKAALGSAVAALLGLLGASAGAPALGWLLLLMAVGLGLYARHWLSLARRSRVGARSEDEVHRALAHLQAEGWRLRHSLPWQGRGDIDSVARTLAHCPAGTGSTTFGGRSVTEPQQQSTSISVMLIVPDADAAVVWYKDALGATELWNLGGVAGLEVDGAPFFLHEVNPKNRSENSPDRLGVTSTRIELFVDDPDRFMERVIAAGATPGSELEDHQQPWGTHRQGGFRDPFGHVWSVGDTSPLSRRAH